MPSQTHLIKVCHQRTHKVCHLVKDKCSISKNLKIIRIWCLIKRKNLKGCLEVKATLATSGMKFHEYWTHCSRSLGPSRLEFRMKQIFWDRNCIKWSVSSTSSSNSRVKAALSLTSTHSMISSLWFKNSSCVWSSNSSRRDLTYSPKKLTWIKNRRWWKGNLRTAERRKTLMMTSVSLIKS